MTKSKDNIYVMLPRWLYEQLELYVWETSDLAPGSRSELVRYACALLLNAHEGKHNEERLYKAVLL